MLIDDSDDERDSFDVERRQIEVFHGKFLQKTFESSDDDDEGIIDGSKIPSSSKMKSRARHSYLDISICSSTSSIDVDVDVDENPFEIISKSIEIETKPKKKTLGIAKTISKPTKNDVLETERKTQQLTRSEQLVLPTFVPKVLQTFHDLEKRSTPEVQQTSTILTDLTKLIDENKLEKKIDRLSRFLNAEILNKKPTIAPMKTSTIDLTETKKNVNPTIKTISSPSSSKKLFDIQKQLAMRMKEKRAAMLAENPINLPEEIEMNDDQDDQDEDESSETDSETQAEVLSTVEREPVLPIDEETRDFISDDEEILPEKINVSNPPSDPNRPSLKTILNRMESFSEPTPTNGQTEWFTASDPVPIDNHLEALCSGTFGEENLIPVSQNQNHGAPMDFSPLPPTQFDDDEEEDLEPRTKSKVRQLSDDEGEPEEAEEEEEADDNEELIDYKKQLFEMEAEESGSENEEKRPNDDDEHESDDDDDQPDEELAKFIDTDAIELDENEIDDMAKVHLKLKAKEDEQQLKLLKEQYLDFDGDDDVRRIKIGRGTHDDDDDDDEEVEEEPSEEEEEEEEEAIDFKDRFSELERQRSHQDNQAEELHLDEDLENIGQHSSMFKKGLALKQKKIQNVTTETNSTRPKTLSSVLLAQRFSSTLLAPVNKLNPLHHSNSNANSTETKKQHNPRRHVFATNTNHSHAQENENPLPSSNSGEKRSNSTEKSPSIKTKRFKQSTTTTTTMNKSNESSTSVFSALGLSIHRH